jgi:hypothetical protein
VTWKSLRLYALIGVLSSRSNVVVAVYVDTGLKLRENGQDGEGGLSMDIKFFFIGRQSKSMIYSTSYRSKQGKATRLKRAKDVIDDTSSTTTSSSKTCRPAPGCSPAP